MITYKNRFKIRRIGNESNIRKLTDLYGGSVVVDIKTLRQGELWYYTDCDVETLKSSGLVEVLGSYPTKERKGLLSNATLLNKLPED